MEASQGVGAAGNAPGGGFRLGAMALAVGMALGLSACGGGGGGGANVRPTSPTTPPSSGTVTPPASGGVTFVDDDQSAATGAITVASGGTLGGKGIIGGSVTVAEGGTLAPGSDGAVGTLTINGNLGFSSGSRLLYDFAVPTAGSGPASDLLDVKGNLTLDGTLEFSAASGVARGAGVYRLINYGGSLTDNGLAVPSGLVVQTGVAHQVNLVDAQDMTLSFWDGDSGPGNDSVVNGGSGTWESDGAGSRSNWTDVNGTANSTYKDGSFAVFQAAPGTVTVDAGKGAVNAAGMQFASDGYIVQGDAIQLTGSAGDPGHSIIRVGDGSMAGSGYTVTIQSALTGTAGLVKTDAGTLVLGGTNTYTGGTTVDGGILRIGDGGTGGSILGDVVDNAVLAFDRSDITSYNGIISGTGGLHQDGTGTLVLTGDNSYTGGTVVSNGILQIGNGGTTGWIAGNIVNDKYLRFNRSDDVLFDGDISGAGSLLKDGAGKLILTGSITEDSANTATRPTVITTGTLQIGNGGTTGSITGDITNNASLVFDRSDTVIFDGKVSGTGSLTQAGSGTLILSNDTFFDSVTIARGTLQIGNGGANYWNVNSVIDNGTLVFDVGYPPGVAGGTSASISGSGNLVKQGPGTYILSADNSYTGGTLISAGTLQLGSAGSAGVAGSVIGDIVNNGVLAIYRSGNLAFANQVTGTGMVQQLGSNTLTITGDLKHTGGTLIGSGTLQIGDGGTTGSLAGDVVDNGTLAFDRSDDQSFSGLISGGGKVIKLGGNTLTFSAENTYAGGTYVTDGTLRLAGGASLGYGTYVGGNQAAAVLRLDHGASIGRITLEDGATLDNAGTVYVDTQYSPAVGGGAASVFNHDGGVIDNVPYSGIDSPAVTLRQNSVLINGAGSLIRGYTGVESQGIVTNDGGSIVGLRSDGVRGAATLIDNINGGTITAGTMPAPYDFAISDGVSTSANNATINNLGASSIRGTLSGTSMLDGGTVTNDGGSDISGDIGVMMGTQSLAFGTVNNTGGSRITGSQTGIYLDFGGIVNNGAGSTIQTTAASSGDCSVTPSCAIYVPVYNGFVNAGLNGSLTLSNAGFIVGDVQMDPAVAHHITLIAGGYIHGALKIGGNAQSTLTLDGDAGTSQLYSNAVTGTTTFGGSLIKNGAGTWTLDNTALQGTIETSVNAGSLRAAQALSGNVTVNTAGTLDGVPGIHGSLIAAGKVAVHGGDTAVDGNYSQASTGTLAVSLGSKLAVTGSATIDGRLEVTGAEPGYVSDMHTEVLAASGGINGTFSELVKDDGVVFTATTINYDANSAWLDTTGLNITTAMQNRGAVLTRASFASAQRVQSAFTQLDTKIAGGRIAEVPSSFVEAAGQFQQAPTVQAAQSSLQSLSGELHAASAAMTFEAIDASNRAMSEHFDDLLARKAGYGMWTHNLSTGGGMGRNGFSGVDFQLNGWMVGTDQQVGSSGVAGFAFGQSLGQQRLDQGADRNRSRNTEGMFYAGTLSGNWYAQGRLGFGHFQQDVNRQLLLGTNAQTVGTQYGGDYNVAYGETGLNLDWAGARVMPFVNVEYANIRRDGFAEEGAGGFGLQANAQTLDRWQAGVGMRANRQWDFGGGRSLELRASAQFQRTVASRGDVFEASFVGLQQYQPLVGIGLSRYSSALNVGLKAALSERSSVDFVYDYQTGQRDQATTVSARWVRMF